MELYLEGVLTIQEAAKIEFFASIIVESGAERFLFYDSEISFPRN
jgi:hypothetical protein